jgi:membrane-associated phospholipid phosphatase
MDLFRILSMYVVPLDPPIGTLDLKDPLIFVVGTGTPITKDLFFSGHTSTMFLLSLTAINKKLKIIFLVSTFLVGFLVVLQKAHYTIDVVVAPFYAYCSYKIIYSLQKKLMPEYFTGE